VTGTALLSSTFLLVKAVVAHQLGPKDYLLYLLLVGYHVAAAYYVESRLAFRNVRPHIGAVRLGPRGCVRGAFLAFYSAGLC
jgi:hypothetical protein